MWSVSTLVHFEVVEELSKMKSVSFERRSMSGLRFHLVTQACSIAPLLRQNAVSARAKSSTTVASQH